MDTDRPVKTGLIPDPRISAAKRLDYLHEERSLPALDADPFASSSPFILSLPKENQWSTSSCVPHAVDLALAIERKLDGAGYVRLAQLFTYRLRSNYPDEGCYLQDVFGLGRHYGAPLFTSLPTATNESEGAANAVIPTARLYQEAEIYKGKEYYTLETPNDIEELAAIGARGHGIPILIFATWAEWAQEYPQVVFPYLKQGDEWALIRHCICVLPQSGFTKDGVRYLAKIGRAHV